MRVVVVGATGNVGSSLVRLLAEDARIDSIVGVARRRPSIDPPKTTWVEADIVDADLVAHFRGADAVVHLAWLIQPSRDLEQLERVNVEGSARVFEAVAEARVPALVYASSVAAYSPGPKDRLVDESWPIGGIPSSFYARHKANVERRLDVLEREQPRMRVVRLRPALIFKREAASGIRRLFAGPFVPSPLLDPRFIPLVPDVPGLRFQAAHTGDVAEAYRLALVTDVRGAFNLAAEPVLDPPLLADLFGARLVPMPAAVARAAVSLSWRLHVQPSPPGWFDLGRTVPLLDCSRARDELGWTPRRRADEALLELIEGMRERAGDDTPPLSPTTGGPARTRELATGVGRRGGTGTD